MCVCECEPRVLLRGMAKNVIISFFTLFFSVDHNYDYYFFVVLWVCVQGIQKKWSYEGDSGSLYLSESVYNNQYSN